MAEFDYQLYVEPELLERLTPEQANLAQLAEAMNPLPHQGGENA